MNEYYVLKINHGFLSWSPMNRPQRGSRRGSAKKIINEEEYLRRAKRQNNAMRKYLLPIISKPEWFATLNFPPRKEFVELNKYSSLEARCLLEKLERSFRYNFPKGFYIWAIEYKEVKKNGKLHCHLIGSSGCEKPLIQMKKWFRKKWNKICDVDDVSTTDIQQYDHGNKRNIHINYLTKHEKLSAKMHVIKHFGTSRTWGKVCKNNIKRKDDISLKVSRKEIELIRDFILDSLYNEANSVENSTNIGTPQKNKRLYKLVKQYEKVESKYCLHFIDEKFKKKILRKLGLIIEK